MHVPIQFPDQIFQEAIRLTDKSARRRFLNESCQGDIELRKKIEQRIEQHFSGPSVLNDTTDGLAADSAVSGVPTVGCRIGPYELLEEIGHGGMGVVFLAQQSEPILRRVALKIIKVGMDTRRVVARFESERQTMALMDHPSITKVLDAGATESGRPYFVMELVKGLPINKYCDVHRMPIRRRLDVFVQVCNALEHAHQKGIIHRDIKPTNVMVVDQDGAPLPKIIDFGIAKATTEMKSDRTATLTRVGEMVGTPLYMSPEQASDGDVDTRSDIYSLGVLLYELLTGTTPFHDLRKNSIQDLREAIRLNDPPTASSRVSKLGDTTREICVNRDTDAHALRRSIRGELDWILTKCLARDRNLRYQSAGELAREIKRFINGEALDAAAPTFWYRTKKFVGKNRTIVTVTAAVACLLAFVSIFSSWMAVHASALAQRATDAEKLANIRLEDVEKERDRAMAAEKRLAQLEREQRNRVAIHQAAALHNADMMKKYLVKTTDGTEKANVSGVQVMSLAKLLKSDLPPLPGTPFALNQPPPRPPVHAAMPHDPSHAKVFSVVVPNPIANDLEIVCDDEGECQASVLKSILSKQKEAFGNDDVMLAVTLNSLGELMSEQEKWGESAEYFNEAVEILKDTADEHPELLKIRENLTKVLQNRGDIKQAIVELQAARKALSDIDLQRDLRTIWDKVKKGLDTKAQQDQ